MLQKKNSQKLNKQIDYALSGLLRTGVFVSLVTTVAMVVLLGTEAIHFFSKVSLKEFLTSPNWEPLIEPRHFGILPLLGGTFMIAFGSILLALPVGLMIAVQMSEFSSPRLRAWLKPTLEVLAGIPTVVFGYFAITVITPFLRTIFPNVQIFNALSATIVVAIMILPTIATLCDDAFRDLPRGLRDAGYSLGATSREVIQQIVLPAASGRVVAAVLLALSRAVGETMAVTLAAGSTPKLTLNFLESIQTMTAFIVQVSLGDVQSGGIEYLSSFAVAFTLLIVTLFMNGFGTYLIIRSPRTSE